MIHRSVCMRRMTMLIVSGWALFAVSVAHAQVTTINDATSTPIEGVGHDYIHMLSETVNPANGSLSLRIQVPTPKSRGFTLPFSFDYDSNNLHFLHPETEGELVGRAEWIPTISFLNQGGWSYSVPMASMVFTDVQVLTGDGNGGDPPQLITIDCLTYSNYMFQDSSGGQHLLGLGTQDGSGICPSSSVGVHGDPQVQGALPPPTDPHGFNPSATPQLPLTVTTADGTVYNFLTFNNPGRNTSINQMDALPSTIEDRNGNIINVTDGGNGIFTFWDTSGRVLFKSNGFGTTATTLTAEGQNYNVFWTTANPNFTPAQKWALSIPQSSMPYSCFSDVPSIDDTQNVISNIVLPNGQQYQFHYGTDNTDLTVHNPYGLLNEIDYPSGAWVKYIWALPSNNDDPTALGEILDYPGGSPNSTPVPDGCVFHYQMPQVFMREVGTTIGAAPILQQTFSYKTNWETSGLSTNLVWDTKVTQVTTQDLVTHKSALTIYTYSSIPAPEDPFFHPAYGGQMPVEESVVYNDYNGSLLREEDKTWNFDSFNLVTDTVKLDNGLTSATKYCYGNSGGCQLPSPSVFSQITEKDEYGFAQGVQGSLVRKTLTNYANLTTPTGGTIADSPLSVIVEDGSGNFVAETDYTYDCKTSTSCQASTSPVSNIVETNEPIPRPTHDERYFVAGSQVRGNLIAKTEKCFTSSGSCTNKATTFTYTYDETGQVVSSTDPCGNSPCSDMSGSRSGTNHATTYSYNDAYTSGGTPPGATNTYLTQITDALGHSSSFAYDYASGNLMSSQDANDRLAGRSTNYTYADPFMRPTEIDYPDGGQTTLCYGDGSRGPLCDNKSPLTVTTSKIINSVSTMVSTATTDGLGRTIEVQSSDPFGGNPLAVNETDISYDGMGRVLTKSNPYHVNSPSATDGTTSYRYDAAGRVCLVIPPDGTQPQGSTCPASAPAGDEFTKYVGNCTFVTDEAGKTRESCTDALGRLTQVFEDPSGLNYETDYTYDPLGNLTKVVQKGDNPANARIRTFSYDSLSRLLSANNPESGTIFYSYDANGNLISKTDARGITTTMTYDVLNRVLTKSYSDGTPTETFYYDSVPAAWATNEQNTIGRLVEVTTGVTPEP